MAMCMRWISTPGRSAGHSPPASRSARRRWWRMGCSTLAVARRRLLPRSAISMPWIATPDASSGNFRLPQGFFSSPAFWDGMIYCGSRDHSLYALDGATGQGQWQFTTGQEITGTPAVHQGMVFCASCDAHCYAIDGKTGELRWQLATPYSLFSSTPAVTDALVCLGGTAGFFYALDSATGQERWKIYKRNRHEEVFGSPTIANGGGVLWVLRRQSLRPGSPHRTRTLEVCYAESRVDIDCRNRRGTVFWRVRRRPVYVRRNWRSLKEPPTRSAEQERQLCLLRQMCRSYLLARKSTMGGAMTATSQFPAQSTLPK